MSVFPGVDPNENAGRLVNHLEHLAYRDVPDPLEGLGWGDLSRLAASEDPLDRVRLYALIRGPLHWVYAPAGTWAVVRTYRDNFMKPAPMSGHLSRENAEAWIPAWDEYSARLGRRNSRQSLPGPYTFHVAQRDDVMASDIRDPAADPMVATAHLGY